MRIEPLQPSDTVEVVVGGEDDGDPSPQRGRRVHSIPYPQLLMGRREVQREPKVFLGEIMKQAQRGNIAGLLANVDPL
jgi:hypothetical protein